jgi:hypothetical protein
MAQEQREESTRLVKLLARFPADQGSISGEGMWALYDETTGLYTLKNTPWFAYGLSWGDLVSVIEKDEGLLEVGHVVFAGGHRTLRVFFAPDFSDADKDLFLIRMQELAVDFELAGAELVALDVGPSSDYEMVLSYLGGLAAGEQLFYEEAWKGEEESLGERALPSWFDDLDEPGDQLDDDAPDARPPFLISNDSPVI